ncbi:SDR family NAD(P)-dependent oxidoreductase [Kineococcus gynurae]|uniref:SDR family NAD(P)-dependent oxidoreductase n=1 Tax=Kineococcus gynurae TaxID=452979 RepID=A0ABV5LWD8_9ACTN
MDQAGIGHARGAGTAVVTGAGGGIGEALARAVAPLVDAVALADLDGTAVERVAASIGPAAGAHRVDVADPAQVEALAAAVPGVRWVFLNAGIVGEHVGAPWEVPPAEWRRVLDVNLGGVVNGLRSFVPRLLAAGGPAHVVVTASLAGAAVFGGGGAYGPSKHAVLAVARHAALALEGTPVRVHVLCPDLVRSGMSEQGREPAEIARRALDLVREDRFAWVPEEWTDAVREGAVRLGAGEWPLTPRPR